MSLLSISDNESPLSDSMSLNIQSKISSILYVIPLGMFLLVLVSAKSNDITNILVNSILVQKYSLSFAYDIIMSPEHFVIKNKGLRPI